MTGVHSGEHRHDGTTLVAGGDGPQAAPPDAGGCVQSEACPPRAIPAPLAQGGMLRVEYLDFQDLAEHREFRLRVCRPDGSTEFRLRVARAAFGAGRLRLQDGPDLCYRKLQRALAGGEAAGPDVVVIDDVELASYRDAHTPVPKRKSWTSPSPPTPAAAPRRPPATPSPRPAPARLEDAAEPGLEAGQRVRHAVFGVGVTASSSGHHTVVWFDAGGSKTFVTSMLSLEVLSAPHTWETGPRGHNRPRPTLSAPAASDME